MSNHPNLGKEPIIFYRKEVEMKDFWEALKESTITQWSVAFALTITVCVLAYQGREIPQLIAYGFTAVLGFAFGAKVQQKLGG